MSRWLTVSPCPFPAYAPLLRPLAAWCLDTFGEGPPMLVGVILGEVNVRFQPVELRESDPIDELADLAAPDPWDVVVVVADTTDLEIDLRRGTVAHAVDRLGASATELDEWCGRRRSLRVLHGRLHDACVEVFQPLHR